MARLGSQQAGPSTSLSWYVLVPSSVFPAVWGFEVSQSLLLHITRVHGVQVAYSPDGSPSKALQGFCKKNGVSVDSVIPEADYKGTEYVWAVVKQPGRPASEVCTSNHSHHAATLLST